MFSLKAPLLLILIVAGCQRAATTTETPARPSAGENLLQYGWYQTHENDATQALITKLTIPGLFKDREEEIRLARYVRVNADGTPSLQWPIGYYGSTHADGRNEKGGFGYGGGINVIGDDEQHAGNVILQVSYYWTTPDQVRGKMDETVSVKVGEPREVKLPGGSVLQVSWREIARP